MKKTTALLALATLAMVLLVAARLYFSSADFVPENPSWNGMTGMTSAANARPLYTIADLSKAGPGDTFMVVSPLRDFSPGETAQVLAFLQEGGVAVVLDDFGSANSLLDGLASPIRLDQVTVGQHDDYYVNQTCPIVRNIVTGPYTSNVAELVFNHPASLTVTAQATVLVYTSNVGWQDRNNNAKLDKNERMGTYPLVASADYGQGKLLVISDPDVFANGMLDKGDNAAFMRNVLKGTVWFDASHGREITPLGTALYFIKNEPLAQLLIVILVFQGGYVFLKRRAIISRFQPYTGKNIKELEKKL